MVQTLKEEAKEENEEDTGRKFEKTQEDTAVRRSSYTQKFFTHRTLCAQTLLHTKVVTKRPFYILTLLHTDTFTHRRFYTQKILHHRTLYTQTLLHTDAFTHKRF